MVQSNIQQTSETTCINKIKTKFGLVECNRNVNHRGLHNHTTEKFHAYWNDSGTLKEILFQKPNEFEINPVLTAVVGLLLLLGLLTLLTNLAVWIFKIFFGITLF